MNLIIKGFIIGIGKILPGVSGSLLAISLGVYEKAIESIKNIFNKDNIIYLYYLSIGFTISIVTMSNVVLFLMNKYYFCTILLFIGLIIGGMKNNFKEVKNEINFIHILYMIIPSLFVIVITNNRFDINLQYNFITMLFLGMIESVTMLIPGLSGTATHMMIGSYAFVMNMFGTLNIKYLIPFILGMIISVLLLVNVISILLKKYETKFHFIILGFSISSIVFLLSRIITKHFLLEYIIGFVIFIISIKIGDKLSG